MIITSIVISRQCSKKRGKKTIRQQKQYGTNNNDNKGY